MVRLLAIGFLGAVVTASCADEAIQNVGGYVRERRAEGASEAEAVMIAPGAPTPEFRRRRQVAHALRTFVPGEVRISSVVAAIDRQAARFGIDPLLVVAVIASENPDLNPTAKSPVGARGIMQVMPQWRRAFRATCGDNLLSVETNVCFGVRVLQTHIEDARGSLERGLLAYVGCRKDIACRQYPKRVMNRWKAMGGAV